MKDAKIGFLYALLASCCYAVISIIVKLSAEVSTTSLLFFRNFMGLLILSPIILRNKKKYKVNRKSFLFFNIIFGFVHLFCFYYAAKKLFSIIDAVMLSGDTGNLFVPLIVYFWDKVKISKIKIFSVIMGFLGVIMVLKPSFACFNFAGLIALIGGISLGISKVGLRKLSKTEYVLTIIYYSFIGNAIISFVPMIICWKTFSLLMWVYVLLISALTLIFQILQTKAYKATSATKVSIVFYSGIIFAGLFDWILFKNVPDGYSIFGAILIMLGGFLVFREKSQAFDKKVEV